MICSDSTAMRLFFRKLNVKFSDTSIRDRYLEKLKQRRRAGDNELVDSFPVKRHSRLLLLGKNLDEKRQLYAKKV